MIDLRRIILTLEGVQKDIQGAISARKHGRWDTFHKKIRMARMDLEVIEQLTCTPHAARGDERDG